jgi:CBS domain-containing protein
MQVKELMTKATIVCRPEDSAHHAAELMWKKDIGCMPVVDAEQRVVGMVTDRDICMAAYTQGQQLAWLPVSIAMSHTVHACAPSDSIAMAEELMRMHQVRRLPVILGGRLVGMLSLNDLARATSSRRAGRTGHESLDGVATTLARIGQPREHHAQAAE